MNVSESNAISQNIYNNTEQLEIAEENQGEVEIELNIIKISYIRLIEYEELYNKLCICSI